MPVVIEFYGFFWLLPGSARFDGFGQVDRGSISLLRFGWPKDFI